MTKCVFKLHNQLLIEGGSYVNCPAKGDCITKVETTYLSLVLVISVGPLSAWRVAVCGAELFWCPVCVSVETDDISHLVYKQQGDMSHNTLPQAIQGDIGIHEYMYSS